MCRHPLLFIAIVLIAAPAAAAQSLEGRAVDRETLRPVSAAMVVMLDSAGQPVAVARTDSAGAFSLASPEPGAFALNVQRTGFGRTLTPPRARTCCTVRRRDTSRPAPRCSRSRRATPCGCSCGLRPMPCCSRR